jgi:hypothetical protein
MDGPGLESRYRQEFSPFCTTSTPALGLSNAYRSSLPGVKRHGHISADVKNERIRTSAPTICLHEVDKDDLPQSEKIIQPWKIKALSSFLSFFFLSLSLSLSPFSLIFLSFPVSVPYFVCFVSLLIFFLFSFFRPPISFVFFLRVSGLYAFHITLQTFATLTLRCIGSLQSLCLRINTEAL